jgi:hypothetical protein
MQIGGFRIQVTPVAAERPRATSTQPLHPQHRTDSVETTHLSWLLLDPEPRPELPASTAAAIADGTYWVPELEISRLLVEDHVVITG